MPSAIDRHNARVCLERLAAHSAEELSSKEPHWGDAIMCDGLLYAARALGADTPAQSARTWFERKLGAKPNFDRVFWSWSAEALPALGLYQLTGEPEYLDYARAVVGAVEERALLTSDRVVVPHPPALDVWVDTVYFVAPAMARLGRITKDGALWGRALEQVVLHARHLLDPMTDLLWHVADIENRRHSPCLWARGNSWFSVAAAQVLGELKDAGIGPALASRAEGVGIELARQLNAVSALQDVDTGLWHTVLEQPTSYLESAASAGFALALGRALNLDLERLQGFRARRAYDHALAGLCSRINRKGEFTGVAEETPPGDFAHYQAIPVDTASFGSGLCMMALAEALERTG